MISSSHSSPIRTHWYRSWSSLSITCPTKTHSNIDKHHGDTIYNPKMWEQFYYENQDLQSSRWYSICCFIFWENCRWKINGGGRRTCIKLHFRSRRLAIASRWCGSIDHPISIWIHSKSMSQNIGPSMRSSPCDYPGNRR